MLRGSAITHTTSNEYQASGQAVNGRVLPIHVWADYPVVPHRIADTALIVWIFRIG
jgi:hypothetical protein